MLKSVCLLALFVLALPAAADCRPPPDFSAWCTAGIRTAVVVNAVPGVDRVDIVVRRIFGEPMEGVVVDGVLPLDCAATSPQCGQIMPAVMLLSSATTFTASQPLVGADTIRFTNAEDDVALDIALDRAFRNDPSLCVESMYGATDTEHSEDFYEDCEESCNDGPFASVLLGAAGLRRLNRRRRRPTP